MEYKSVDPELIVEALNVLTDKPPVKTELPLADNVFIVKAETFTVCAENVPPV